MAVTAEGLTAAVRSTLPEALAVVPTRMWNGGADDECNEVEGGEGGKAAEGGEPWAWRDVAARDGVEEWNLYALDCTSRG